MSSRSHLLTSRSTALVAGSLLTVALVTSGAIAHRAALPAADDRTESEALSGLVRTTDGSTIATPVAVTIADVLVAIGEEVANGQPIARRDVADAERELAQLALELERATQDVIHRERTLAWLQASRQRLVENSPDAPGELGAVERDEQQLPMRRAKDSPGRAQVAFDQAALKVRRAEQLRAAGLVSGQDVEEARLAMRFAADDVANAWQAAERAAALVQARLQLRAVRMRHESARAASADQFIRTPRGGAVVELPVSPGDRLAAGATVARIARLDPMGVDVDVAPRLVNLLHVRDIAYVDVPASGVVRTEAAIRSIAPIPNDAGAYAVQLTFPNSARLRLAGQAAEVRFTLGQRPPTR